MQHPVPFLFEDAQLVRVVLIDEVPWFVAADVCRILSLKNVTKAISGLDPEEIAIHTLTSTEGIPGNPTVNVVSESGLYALIFKSKKPAAVKFRKWVTSEVLPLIRRTGHFGDHDLLPPLRAEKRTFPDWPMEEMRTKRGVGDMYRMVYGVMAAQWILPQLGFPVPPKELIQHGRQLDLFQMIAAGE